MYIHIRHVLLGKARPFGPQGQLSGIHKSVTTEEIHVQMDRLVGDEQGDTRRHGGPEKVIHHYPYEHYTTWRQECPQIEAQHFVLGAFGENISTTGMTEKNVCIGDVFRLGSSTIQVSQGRQPCWKLNIRFAHSSMAKRVQESRRTGWYYRVLEEGTFQAGDTLERIEQPNPHWPISRVLDILYDKRLDPLELRALSELRELTDSWRTLAERRIQKSQVEDWTKRLITPEDM